MSAPDDVVAKTKRAHVPVRPLPVWLFWELLLDDVAHLFDGCLAAPLLRDPGVLTAAALGDLANEGQIASLQLARCELLGRNGRTATASALAARLSAGAGRFART